MAAWEDAQRGAMIHWDPSAHLLRAKRRRPCCLTLEILTTNMWTNPRLSDCQPVNEALPVCYLSSCPIIFSLCRCVFFMALCKPPYYLHSVPRVLRAVHLRPLAPSIVTFFFDCKSFDYCCPIQKEKLYANEWTYSHLLLFSYLLP